MSSRFTYAEHARSINVLIEKILLSLENDERYAGVAQTIRTELEAKQADSQVRVAFVGQYSAGKSTIISALTGNNAIKIDSDVATDQAANYDWNGIVLTDTPGLHAGRSDHDEAAQRAIRNSDILVYCLTYSLFDNLLLEDFKKLAFDREYQSKMILVVNKMYSEEGEYEELVKNYTTSLKKQLSGFDLGKFPISFVSAQFERESDPEIREYSHFSDFVENLNDFVKEKGLYAKQTSLANLVLDHIDHLLVEEQADADRDFYTLLDRVEKNYVRVQRDTDNEMRNTINRLESELRQKASECASLVGTPELTNQVEEAGKHISRLSREYYDNLFTVLETKKQDLQKELEKISNSDLARYYFEHNHLATDRADMPDFKTSGGFDDDNEFDLERAKKINKFLSTASNGVAKFSAGAKDVSFGFLSSTGAAGSGMHQAVLKVGQTVGYKFQPWEAINIAKNFGNVAKGLGAVAAALPIVFEIVDVYSENKRDNEVQENRRKLISEFTDIGKQIVKSYQEEYASFVAVMLDNPREMLKKMRSDSLEKSRSMNESQARIRRECNELKGVFLDVDLV